MTYEEQTCPKTGKAIRVYEDGFVGDGSLRAILTPLFKHIFIIACQVAVVEAVGIPVIEIARRILCGIPL